MDTGPYRTTETENVNEAGKTCKPEAKQCTHRLLTILTKASLVSMSVASCDSHVFDQKFVFPSLNL
jgi:hypothetical protein